MIKQKVRYINAYAKAVHFHIDRFSMSIEIHYFHNGRLARELSYSDETFMVSDFANWCRKSLEND